MQKFIYEWENTDAPACFERICRLHYSIFLDSSMPEHAESRYSYICWNPTETVEAKNGVINVINREQKLSFYGDPFEILKDRITLWSKDKKHDSCLPPFQGGAAGLFGYDLARGIEKIPVRAKYNIKTPDMAIGIYDNVIAFDNLENRAWLIIHAETETEATVRKRHIERLVNNHRQNQETTLGQKLHWHADKNEQEYKKDIQTIIDKIHAGEVFQVNLSRRLGAQLPRDFDTFAHYRILREISPAPFAAYINLGDIKISSSSPERFLKVTNAYVETKPIKGTRPVIPNDEEKDKKIMQELAKSEKDRAENLMIVDLLRNDISRTCKTGSVKVPKMFELETFEGVHHLVSTITGELEQDKTAIDLLKTCFPGGSVTGAPKVKAMEIIENMEPARRGAYCGSIGYVGYDGSMDTNIAIRTLIFYKNSSGNNMVSLQTGGGIVHDSIPDNEFQETLDKAAKILESFDMLAKPGKKAESKNKELA